jgi:hypothetical protein
MRSETGAAGLYGNRRIRSYAAKLMTNNSILSDDIVRGVGRVVVNFQHLEFTVVRLLWIMAAPDDNIGQCITACVLFSKLLDLLDSVFRYRVQHPAILEKFKTLMSRTRDINTDRNRIVHSWWFTDPDGAEPSRLKLSRKGSQDTEAIDMNALAVRAANLADEFDEFIDELYRAKLIRKKPGISLESLS